MWCKHLGAVRLLPLVGEGVSSVFYCQGGGCGVRVGAVRWLLRGSAGDDKVLDVCY